MRPDAAPPRLAYLINQYPKVSHSFIRREIHALERLGFEVARYAIRSTHEGAPDALDRAEALRTRHVLQQPLGAWVTAVAGAVARGRAFWQALALALRLGLHGDRPLPYYLVYFAEACVVAAWLRRDGIGHLHAHFGTNSAMVAMLASRLSDVPYSFTVHGPEEFDRPQHLALAAKARHAAFVVAISSFGRSQLYRWIDRGDWPKVRVVHCGLDDAYRSALTRSDGEAHRLVCVGRLSEQKGQLLLLDALRRVLDAGLDATLVLAGDGEMRVPVEARCAALNLGSHVRITGWLSGEQVQQELLRARALVLPSFAEGLPVVIMEAMALGRPVLSTYVAGIPELVTGDCGWLVPAGDADALAQAMIDVLRTDATRLAAMGTEARARVWARHDIDAQARLLADAIVETARARAG